MICGEDAEKALTICVCVHLEGEKKGGGGSSWTHKYCISLFDGCLTHFHASLTNSTVIFFLLSVIFQTADPDNYPRETPDQNHLILSAAQLRHTLIPHHSFPSRTQSLFDSRYVYSTTHLLKCKKIAFIKRPCHVYFTDFVMSICRCIWVITVLQRSDCHKGFVLSTVAKQLIHRSDTEGNFMKLRLLLTMDVAAK